MRSGDERGIATLGFFALAATVVLIVRLSLRIQRRRLLRDVAVKSLRTSGEFYALQSPADLAGGDENG